MLQVKVLEILLESSKLLIVKINVVIDSEFSLSIEVDLNYPLKLFTISLFEKSKDTEFGYLTI